MSTSSTQYLNLSNTLKDPKHGHASTSYTGALYVVYIIVRIEVALSILCLIFSLIVYLIIPEFKNLHGKNLISLTLCLLSALTLRITDFIFRHQISSPFCITMGILTHINYLAFFFWTNVMAFDIWRSITSMKQKHETTSNSRKYLKYSVYVWSATIITALPAALFEMTDWIPQQYKPRFGVKRCYLSGTTAYNYYFNIPVGIIMFTNLLLFLLTTKELYYIKKMTSILQIKQQQQRLNLYLKLFFAMGITWLSFFPAWVTGIHKLYAVGSVLTALHGVLLCVIFALKRRILRQLWDACLYGGLQQKKNSSNLPTLSSNEHNV